MLKPTVLDPQGQAIQTALRNLSIQGVTAVRQGKVFEVHIDSNDQDEALRAVKCACEKLLCNPVIETYSISNGV